MNIKSFLFVFMLCSFFSCETKDKKMDTQLLETKVGLDNVRWIATDVKNAGVEIKDGKMIMFQEVAERIVSTIYDYELSEKDGVEYLTLKNDSGKEIIYGLLEYSDESMVLSYLNRGSTLTYTKEK